MSSALQTLSDRLWLEGLANLVTEYSFLQPICETLHFIGLALLVGVVGVYDLRMLGVAKSLQLAPLHRLLPWGIAGFALCLLTGLVFVLGDPFKLPSEFLRNISFVAKMICVALAGANVAVFYLGGFKARVDRLGPGGDAPFGAKVIAASSLALWIGVMYFGRMLPWSDALYLVFRDPDVR